MRLTLSKSLTRYYPSTSRKEWFVTTEQGYVLEGGLGPRVVEIVEVEVTVVKVS